jgi:hypothetical protein
MAGTFSLYDRVVRITHIYLGPAANRFIDRQAQNHLKKSPKELTANDLVILIDWIRVAVSLLTDDKEIIEEYVAQLRLLTQEKNTKKHKGSK